MGDELVMMRHWGATLARLMDDSLPDPSGLVKALAKRLNMSVGDLRGIIHHGPSRNKFLDIMANDLNVSQTTLWALRDFAVQVSDDLFAAHPDLRWHHWVAIMRAPQRLWLRLLFMAEYGDPPDALHEI